MVPERIGPQLQAVVALALPVQENVALAGSGQAGELGCPERPEAEVVRRARREPCPHVETDQPRTGGDHGQGLAGHFDHLRGVRHRDAFVGCLLHAAGVKHGRGPWPFDEAESGGQAVPAAGVGHALAPRRFEPITIQLEAPQRPAVDPGDRLHPAADSGPARPPCGLDKGRDERRRPPHDGGGRLPDHRADAGPAVAALGRPGALRRAERTPPDLAVGRRQRQEGGLPPARPD